VSGGSVERFAWIAVAVATAIRLLAPLGGAEAIAVALLAIAALIVSCVIPRRDARATTLHVRVAALVLIAVAIIDGGTTFLANRVATSFAARSQQHLDNQANRLRKRIVDSNAELDAVAQRVAGRLTQKPEPSRGAMFAMLHDAVDSKPGRGMRIVAENGDILAWWGEDLRVSGAATYLFDATNLYVTRTRNVPRMAVQAFERITNGTQRHELFNADDDWLSSIAYHAGVLRQQSGSRRYILNRRPDATLYVDIMPAPRTDMVRTTQDDGRDLSSLLIALGALALLAMTGIRRPLLLTIVLLVIARIAMLSFTVDVDPTHIFGFDVYASRILGPFSKSPFDLLLTAATLLAMIVAVTRRAERLETMPVTIIRSVVAAAAAAAMIFLVSNLADNSRITSIPDHIAPGSLAQATLLTAMLLFGFALLQLVRGDDRLRNALAGTAVVAVLSASVWWQFDHPRQRSLVCIVLAIAGTYALQVATRRRSLRLFGQALMMMLIVFYPLQTFERATARRFISDTYAPLVAGEGSQMRTMIEDTLRNEFSRTDLGTILPDHYTRMNLDDLAYALWLHSDLSKWRIPAVITIRDIFEHQISRFGVGLPQFKERGDVSGGEVLQLGAMTRELIHHDFELTVFGIPVGEGSVHVVNPTDPSAATFADAYRDFFQPGIEESPISLHAQREPVVYDRDGNAHGTSVRLPQTAAFYFARLKPGEGLWIRGNGSTPSIYVLRMAEALYAFPLPLPTVRQLVRRAGSVAIWGIALVAFILAIRALPLFAAVLRRSPRALDFRTRTSLYLVAVVILPLLVFVIFVRAYLATRLETEYFERGQTALVAAQRVIEDYLASNTASSPEQVLDDDVLSWLARVIGHDLHLYHGETVIASSRRDLFAAHIESVRLPGDVFTRIVLGGEQLVRARRETGSAQYIEIYSPINLERGQNYTLALPFIVQGRQIEEQVNDLATTIYMLLVFIAIASIGVAVYAARSVTKPVQALVGGARAIAHGDFDVRVAAPHDPDLGLLVTTFRDMAQSIRRQQNDLRHERDRLQTLLENINAAVVVLDGAMRVGATNAAARALFGVTESGDAFRPPFHEMREFLAQHRLRRADANELELNIDGNIRTFRVSIVPLPDSEEEMLIAEDVSEILRSNRLEAWGEMARQVAHEIKNPLTPIQLTAEHLRAVAERNDPQLADVVENAVDNILRQVVTLRETSKEFSDYASLRQVQRRPLDLRRLLEELASSYAASGERGIAFRADIEPSTPEHFSGDPRLLRGAIANLIENAFQAAPGGTVRLGSHAVDSKVIVSVEDSGPGVSPALLPKIFDPYLSTKTSGTGLGLAIARKAIEEHGGHVHAENLNPGFRISIELPMK